MKILGIETSCDDTAVAIIDNKHILSNLVASQTDLHREFGGVVPEIAARGHIEVLDKLIAKSLAETSLNFADLDGIAVTAGPGLIGGVMVGLMTAKAIASVHKKPFIAVNHLEAHALTARLTNDVAFPYLLLLVSGGHCQILLVKNVGEYQKIGWTLDDAVGECFDKVAIMQGLGYPGGPQIEKYALRGDENHFIFPKPLLQKNPIASANAVVSSFQQQFCFSFSGLKTAVRREIERLSGAEYNHFTSYKKLSEQEICDLSASFQKTIAEILINRLHNVFNFLRSDNSLPSQKITSLVIAGGVAANRYLYKKIADFMWEKHQLETIAPPVKLCTDNGVMVAWVGVEKMRLNLCDSLDFKPRAKWDLA